VYWSYDIGGADDAKGAPRASDINAWLEKSLYRADVRLLSGENTERILPTVLGFLQENKFHLELPRELGHPD
jgi:hypothetical protein